MDSIRPEDSVVSLLKQIWDQYYSDREAITEKDLMLLLEIYGYSDAAERAHLASDLSHTLDTDGDGEISRDEFLAATASGALNAVFGVEQHDGDPSGRASIVDKIEDAETRRRETAARVGSHSSTEDSFVSRESTLGKFHKGRHRDGVVTQRRSSFVTAVEMKRTNTAFTSLDEDQIKQVGAHMICAYPQIQ